MEEGKNEREEGKKEEKSNTKKNNTKKKKTKKKKKKDETRRRKKKKKKQKEKTLTNLAPVDGFNGQQVRILVRVQGLDDLLTLVEIDGALLLGADFRVVVAQLILVRQTAAGLVQHKEPLLPFLREQGHERLHHEL